MRVIGFEPVKKNWELGQQSIHLNHLQDQMVVHHAAVHWSGERMRIMHNFSREADGALNAGQGTLGAGGDGRRPDLNGDIDPAHVELVDTIALSDAVKEDVWLMKLDVEGCECHCLKSGEELFKKYQVRALHDVSCVVDLIESLFNPSLTEL